MGLRLILVLGAVWLLFILARRALRNRRQAGGARAARPAVDMVRCARCGTHLPAPEALQQSGRYYCCRAHLEADDGKSRET